MSDRNATKILEILLVEDTKSDAYLTQEALAESSIHHRLHIVKDGVEAIDFLYQRHNYTDVPSPDLILLDLNLPRKNGFEVLAIVKADATLKSIPVVVVTTSACEADQVQAAQLEAISYFIKPIELDQLMDLLQGIAAVN
ncbi:MAG: response regulator [Acaryochloris sp. RU_4_1]|nr:response regulator [Acaryochloris sp. RU_4_1]